MFTDRECYLLFLAVDDQCRQLAHRPPDDFAERMALRERLLPFYRREVERMHPTIKMRTA